MENDLIPIESTMRRLLDEAGKLAGNPSRIKADDDLYELGLSSLATVGLMVAIEDAFDVEIPDELLTRDNFRSLGTLTRLIQGLSKAAAA